MSATPVLPSLSSYRTRRSANGAWMPVVYGLIFVCFTSTAFMGGGHTQIWVDDAWKAIFGNWRFDVAGPVNFFGRKIGHFFGYGMIGILFRNAWYSSVRAASSMLRTRRLPFAASLGVASTFVVANLDEWHQKYLPGRHGSIYDALLDTAGALFLNTILWMVLARRRRNANSGH